MARGGDIMTGAELMQAVSDYLQMRRALGYQLLAEESVLRSLARFAMARNHQGPLTCALAEDWARASKRADPYTWSRRLSVVRPFARYLSGIEPGTEIPGLRTFGPAHRRLPPYVLTAEEVHQLIATAAQLPPKGGLAPLTYSTFFALLACTGMRVSEAIRLQSADVDLVDGLLQIRKTKFGKSRLIPLHPSTLTALQQYSRQRDVLAPVHTDTAFFKLDGGIPLTYSLTRNALRRVRWRLGWHKMPVRRRPTLRALRHTFACRRLAAWYEGTDDVNQRVHALSTYMGHGKVSDTYWYLSGLPDLLAIAAQRFVPCGNSAGGHP
jgi:integrase/recombinase XerD